MGKVRLRTSFILSSQPWEIGSPGWMDEVVLCRTLVGHTYLIHSYILKKDPPPRCEHCQCNLRVRHILVECNHLAQTRNDMFGRCGVVESLRLHLELVFLNKEIMIFIQNIN